MEESVTYQAIIQKGEAKGLTKGVRKSLLRVGEKRFGSPPDKTTLKAINAIDDVERLDQLVERALEVSTWQELLNLPTRPPRPRERRSPSP